MKTVIIGSGNVAYHIAKALKEKALPVVQIFGRNELALKEISEELEIPYSTTQLAEADMYIISVKDESIAEVSGLITNERAIVAHTSGATSINDLKGNYRKAVMYPLQTFSKTKNLVYAKIPFFIDAETKEVKLILKNFIAQVSDRIAEADDEKRKYIHLTAVFACNFVNHLYARAKEIADKQDIPFDFFLPLIDETTEKIHHLDPKSAQTGPAVRNDQNVLSLHQSLITDEEQMKIYLTINNSIQKMYGIDKTI